MNYCSLLFYISYTHTHTHTKIIYGPPKYKFMAPSLSIMWIKDVFLYGRVLALEEGTTNKWSRFLQRTSLAYYGVERCMFFFFFF